MLPIDESPRSEGRTLEYSVDPPSVAGYTIGVTSSCGEVLNFWVTPESARDDLIFSTLPFIQN